MAEGTPTQVTTVLTTVQWNALIDKVNNATQSCGGGGIAHVTDPHLWSLQDIKAVQNALKAGCSTATFTTPVGPPYIWMQTIIDEINKALSAACCNGGGGTGPSGATGPTVFLYIVYLCDCYPASVYADDPDFCHACVSQHWQYTYMGQFWQSNKSYPPYGSALAAATATVAGLNASSLWNGSITHQYRIITVGPGQTAPPLGQSCPCIS